MFCSNMARNFFEPPSVTVITVSVVMVRPEMKVTAAIISLVHLPLGMQRKKMNHEKGTNRSTDRPGICLFSAPARNAPVQSFVVRSTKPRRGGNWYGIGVELVYGAGSEIR